MNFSSRLRHNNSSTHMHKETFDIVVKENETTEAENAETDYIVNKINIDCRDKFFHTFENG